MNPVACDFTRKCSQLLSYMGYLWTSLQQSLYLGAMVWVKSEYFLWFHCLSLVKSTSGDMNSLHSDCTTQVFHTVDGEVRALQLHLASG